MTSIGNTAFKGCSGLTSITIPDSVTKIGSNAFEDSGLFNGTANNSVVYADKWAVGRKGTLTEVALKSDTVGIADEAFSRCTGLTSITIPNSVTSIGGYAFDGCTGLTSIIIPNSVTSIDSWAFSRCSGLTSITIPTSVTSIGTNAFYSCDNLKINCEVEAKPTGWDNTWNGDCPVVWGYKAN